MSGLNLTISVSVLHFNGAIPRLVIFRLSSIAYRSSFIVVFRQSKRRQSNPTSFAMEHDVNYDNFIILNNNILQMDYGRE
jgi:hypothetical protein